MTTAIDPKIVQLAATTSNGNNKTDENLNIVSGDTKQVSEDTKVPIDPDDPKTKNNDTYNGGDDDDNAAGEDSITKPLTMLYQGDLEDRRKMAKDIDFMEPRPPRLKDVLLSQMWQPKKREWRLILFVLFLFILIIVGLVVIYHLHHEELYYIYHSHNVTLHKSELEVRFKNSEGDVVLSGTFWKNPPPRGKPYDCSGDDDPETDGPNSLCLLWKNHRRLEIDHFELGGGSACNRIRWYFLSAESGGNSDCFDLGEGVRWFGAGIVKHINGTLDTASIPRQAFLTERLHDSGAFGPVLDRFFLSSEGVAIIVESNSSLELSVNAFDPNRNTVDGQLCLHTMSPSLPRTTSPESSRLAYLICTDKSITHVRKDVLSLLVSNQTPEVVSKDIFSTVVWSTWGYFKEQYNESSLIHFADQIAERFKGKGVLMIDDGWETETGDLEFVTSKFPDPRSTVEALHSKNFRVSLQVRTQVSTKSAAFHNTTIQKHLVQSYGDEVPGLTRWWDGPHDPEWDRGLAALYDLTDTELDHLLLDRLSQLQERYGFDAYHIGGTETSSLPTYSTTTSAGGDRNKFTRRGVEMAASLGSFTVVEAASGAQNISAPIIIRLKDGTSTWDGVGGLQSVIPSALTLGLLGYPWFISESAGGSAYRRYPTKELFLRWFQVSVFFPIVHLSVPPWFYDNETEATVDKLLKVRETLILPELVAILKGPNSLVHSPFIRPIWWLDPADSDALGVVTEFLVGNNILVAPILEEGKTKRDIYLPRGLWRDPLLGVNHSGGRWLRGYVSNLTNVAYFIRQ